MATCRYTIDGYLECTRGQSMKKSVEHFALADFGQVCPPGSYSQKCESMTCKNGLMHGYCQQNNMAIKEVNNFETSKCQGKDIYFDTFKNVLSCE